MGQGYSGGATVSVDTVIHRWRELPLPGDIAVKAGELVEADTVIGCATLSGEGVIVRVAEELGLLPDEAIRCATVNVGDTVKRGDIIALHRVFFGLFRAEVTAPTSGIIELMSDVTGTILIRCDPQRIERTAFIKGYISAVRDTSAVQVTSSCTLVQGVFGVGGERFGTLRILRQTGEIASFEPSPDDEGAIIISQGPPTLAALNQAAERKIAGWVAGSISDSVVEAFAKKRIGVAITGDEHVPFPLFVTEGFGSIPMSSLAFDAFAQNEGRSVSLTGVTQVRAGAVRPEVVIPHPDQSPKTEQAGTSDQGGLIRGRTVRLIRHPYFGQIGTIQELPPEPRPIGTGALARVAVVLLKDGSTVEVPRANIEILVS